MKHANRKGCLSPYDYWQKLKTDKELFKTFYENRLRCSDWFNEKQGANFHIYQKAMFLNLFMALVFLPVEKLLWFLILNRF